ncbi:hypothetical protein V1511DRAFT_489889 [Dipodascopsis uninucleata]
MSIRYRILSKGQDDIKKTVEKYKLIRLRALKSAKDAFHSTYEQESQMDSSQWETRITNPLATTIIAELEDQGSEYIAIGVLLGPLNAEQSASFLSLTLKNASEVFPSSEIRYVFCSFYVDIDYQHKGIGRGIFQTAIEYIKQQNIDRNIASKIAIRLNVLSDNETAIRFYEKFGMLKFRSATSGMMFYEIFV